MAKDSPKEARGSTSIILRSIDDLKDASLLKNNDKIFLKLHYI